MSSQGIKGLLGSQPKLRHLSLYWSPAVDDAVLLTLCGACPQLTHLSLSGCSAITDDGVCTLTGALPGLQALDLTRCGPAVYIYAIDVRTCMLLVRCLGLGRHAWGLTTGLRDADILVRQAHTVCLHQDVVYVGLWLAPMVGGQSIAWQGSSGLTAVYD